MDLWQSRAKAPDQDGWIALGKCFELEPSAFFFRLILKVLHIDSFKFLIIG